MKKSINLPTLLLLLAFECCYGDINSNNLTNCSKIDPQHLEKSFEDNFHVKKFSQQDLNDVVIESKPLAEGKYGAVFRGKIKGIDVIIKVPKVQPNNIIKEYKASNDLFSSIAKGNFTSGIEDIVFSYGLSYQNDNSKLHGLIQPLIKGKNGFDAIHSKNPIPLYSNGFIKDPLKAIICAITFMNGVFAIHKQGFVHRDLKLKNIMLQQPQSSDNLDFSIRIIDLGSVVKTGTKTSLTGTTKKFIPPEIYFYRDSTTKKLRSRERREKYVVDTSQDIYSAGFILLSLLTGHKFMEKFYQLEKVPGKFSLYDILTNITVSRMLDRKKTEVIQMFIKILKVNDKNGKKIFYPETTANELGKIIGKCLSANPSERPDAEKILKSLKNLCANDSNVQPSS